MGDAVDAVRRQRHVAAGAPSQSVQARTSVGNGAVHVPTAHARRRGRVDGESALLGPRDLFAAAALRVLPEGLAGAAQPDTVVPMLPRAAIRPSCPHAPTGTSTHFLTPETTHFSHHHTRTACEELARVTVGTLARSARCEQTTWRGRTSASTTARGEARACRWRWCCAGVVVAWQVASGHPNLRDQPPLWAGRGLPAVAVETRARTRFRTELVPLREGRVGHRLLARPGDFRPEEIAEYRRERSPAHLRVRDAAALHHVSSSRHIRSAHPLGAYLSAYLGVYLGAYLGTYLSAYLGAYLSRISQVARRVPAGRLEPRPLVRCRRDPSRAAPHVGASLGAYLGAYLGVSLGAFSAHTWACTSAVSRRRTARATPRRRTSSSSRCTSRSATTRTGILL